MTREERENAVHCLKVMIDEEVCEECKLYGTTGTDHCEKDCVRLAIEALEQEDILDKIDEIITDALDKSTDQKESQTLRWVLDKISEVI